MNMYVNRDPFAREETHKEPITGDCDWCGSQNRYGKVWEYRIETDGGRSNPVRGKFCSISCLHAFHD